LREVFGGSEVSIDEIAEFVITQTPYRETHLRKLVLIPMEQAHPAQLTVVDALPARRKGQYPPGTVLKFL
jgi:hypothetical protein